ncbi:hypothetical protein [Arenimonas daejeonensis]|uniref:hypothetical protein n=1 Tax=Arenimonas daejeonensis TaxID=370777 RepID=UPI0011BDE312|nr:hypothetical protein [Arenimonas daejeonensis]
MTRLFRSLLLFSSLLLAACAGTPERPDLARLYEAETSNPHQPPVILIHGLMGSTLVEKDTGKEFWPGGLGSLAFSEYRELARMKTAEAQGGGLVPGDLFYGVARTDFYGALRDTLENIGRFKRGTPGTPVSADDRRRYYVLLYDWRKENLVAVRQLHELINQIRRDYNDPDLAVDIVAHSNGGLIANYYLRYGPKDVLTSDEFILEPGRAPDPPHGAAGHAQPGRRHQPRTPAAGFQDRLAHGAGGGAGDLRHAVRGAAASGRAGDLFTRRQAHSLRHLRPRCLARAALVGVLAGSRGACPGRCAGP